MARTPVLPEATPVGVFSALLSVESPADGSAHSVLAGRSYALARTGGASRPTIAMCCGA